MPPFKTPEYVGSSYTGGLGGQGCAALIVGGKTFPRMSHTGHAPYAMMDKLFLGVVSALLYSIPPSNRCEMGRARWGKSLSCCAGDE